MLATLEPRGGNHAMSRLERKYDKAADLASRIGVLPVGDTLLAATTARLSAYTAETGEYVSFPRPPTITIGLSETAIFAYDREGFTSRGFLALVTHALQQWDSISLQWATSRETAACLHIQNVVDVARFFAEFKRLRDAIWTMHPREEQLALTYFSGSRPGVNWRNEAGLSLEQYFARHRAFLEGAPAVKSPQACALADAPVTHTPAEAASARLDESAVRPAVQPSDSPPVAPAASTPPRRRVGPKRR
jgi:hypothetical protein